MGVIGRGSGIWRVRRAAKLSTEGSVIAGEKMDVLFSQELEVYNN